MAPRRLRPVIEAKPEGTPLTGVEWQSAMYADGLPPEVRLKALTVDGRLPFVFEASGSETHFTNGYDPGPRARSIFAVPQPARLAREDGAVVRGAGDVPQRGGVATGQDLGVRRLLDIQMRTGVRTVDAGIARTEADAEPAVPGWRLAVDWVMA